MKLGLEVGSTTIKYVVLDDNENIILKDYKNENDYTDYKIRASSSIFLSYCMAYTDRFQFSSGYGLL